jgi:hypothetical protein
VDYCGTKFSNGSCSGDQPQNYTFAFFGDHPHGNLAVRGKLRNSPFMDYDNFSLSNFNSEAGLATPDEKNKLWLQLFCPG